ncbi:hypothetical protein XACM_2510 [Xanthomonas euvesicatoria pv. citrumelo F1]|nr:hypothetical protein XACM_2510 [Xanthomonas euvesicatoria pv. citrumelo F1]
MLAASIALKVSALLGSAAEAPVKDRNSNSDINFMVAILKHC